MATSNQKKTHFSVFSSFREYLLQRYISQIVFAVLLLILATNSLCSFSSSLYAAPISHSVQQRLSPADLKHGERELFKMLTSLPAMRQMVKKDDLLWRWAVRQYAGEASAGRIVWTHMPSDYSLYTLASHSGPYGGKLATIAIRAREFGRPIPAEELWSSFVFESINIQKNNEFMEIYKDAMAGKIGEDEYVQRHAQLEFSASQDTYRLYRLFIKPYADKKHFVTHPIIWGQSLPLRYSDWIATYTDRSGYPWNDYGKYYRAVVAPCLRRNHIVRCDPPKVKKKSF